MSCSQGVVWLSVSTNKVPLSHLFEAANTAMFGILTYCNTVSQLAAMADMVVMQKRLQSKSGLNSKSLSRENGCLC